MSPVELLASVLLVAGTAFVVLAVAGLWRFDDLFSRLHAATKAVTMGVILTLMGAATQVSEVGDAAKLALTAVLLLVTSPVSAHMIARSSYGSGLAPSDLVEDHLAPNISTTPDPDEPS